MTTISGGTLIEQKVHIIPNSMQLASHEPTLTFQNNYGILLGVNLNIQSVLLSLYLGR
jgi:hypothetical protein